MVEWNGRIKFVPDRFVKIYHNWMTNAHDWCISRQPLVGQSNPRLVLWRLRTYYRQPHETRLNVKNAAARNITGMKMSWIPGFPAPSGRFPL
jgi:valyl-tRNA synthetase